MTRSTWVTLSTALGLAGVFGGALFLNRRANAAGLPSSNGSPPTGSGSTAKFDLAPLPTAADVKGDLVRNWGDTPIDLRPLFLLMEETSRIKGSGRVFAAIASRESSFVTTAHNGNAADEQDERDDSRKAYDNNKDRNPPLAFGQQSADFGSGGLFGALSPYFLWTGVPEVGAKAPLLRAAPEICFQPRAAAFGAVVYMQRILKNRTDDIADIKAGWANPQFLTTARGSERALAVRARFLADVQALGIDLADAVTIPPKLDASAWPGVPAVFASLVGALPKELA